MLTWDATLDVNGSSRMDWLDEPAGSTNTGIAKLEAAAGTKAGWDWDDDCGESWWGLTGTFGGKFFHVYTHKSGCLKIGGFHDGLDLPGLKAALLAIIGG